MLEYDNCPSCGAPVKYSLTGCEYCGREFREVHIQFRLGFIRVRDVPPGARLSNLINCLSSGDIVAQREYIESLYSAYENIGNIQGCLMGRQD